MLESVLRSWIGLPPEGLEYLEYAAKLIMFVILYQFVADVFRMWSKFLGGR